ncbi:hypothetical protein Pfo_011452 [Paulownia fortunei]|nr:hypothetical protein Pfo_011452 [Paulownia fortunei]
MILSRLLKLLVHFSEFSLSAIFYAYDVLDPNGNITAVVTIFNFQQYRHIKATGWKLGQATEQGDCSRFKLNIPCCCNGHPAVVDLLSGTPYNQQIANCCKGGVISSWVQDPANAVSSFQLSVGQAGISNKTVMLPKNFTSQTPGPGYNCGCAKIVVPSKFTALDKKRGTQALSTPTCCVSLSSSYDDMIVNCPTGSCGCRSITQPGTFVESDSPHLLSVVSVLEKNNLTPLVHCTSHMCPIRVHWHVKLNYEEYWHVKMAITNFNYGMNYKQWNRVVQHPNFDNLTNIFSFNYKPLTPYGSTNDTVMLCGIKFYNDLCMQAIYFNGDNCIMPSPDADPYLPNDSVHTVISLLTLATSIVASLVILLAPA